MEPTLAASALISSVASGAFLSVSLRLQLQATDGEAGMARRLFAMWWMALAVYAVAGSVLALTAAMGVEALEIAVAVEYMQAFSLCIGLWGLASFLGYLLTGSARVVLPLALFFAAYYGAILFVVTAGRPSMVEIEPWRARLLFEAPLVDRFAAAILLVIPPLAAAATYLLIYARSRGALPRFRLAVLAAATLAWCASRLAFETDVVGAVPPLLALASAFLVERAYSPPRWVRDAAEPRPLER